MPPADPTPITSDQIERLVEALDRIGRTHFAWLLTEIGVDTIGEISLKQYTRAMSLLQQKRRRLEEEQTSA